ncbi:signal peptide protein [Streptomyces sp. NPDC059104]|uniref:signal peptide protein n=1 Tax=Streptomyces sp. NPDC059104 TaxID=3346729 RepID=UPI0036C0A978
MPWKKTRTWVSAVTAAAAVAAVAVAAATTIPSMAEPRPSATSPSGQPSSAVIDFVDLPTSPLPTDEKQHEFTVEYRNDSAADQTAAPQLLIVSPDAGPFLTPSDVTLERLSADGHWGAVKLGSQTGSLYTDLSLAKVRLPSGRSLTERYRLSVVTPGAEGTVHPRVALFD